jgi:predicted metal-dependent phosphoesterase TrpH
VRLKVELHTHTSDDPVDAIPYSAMELVDRAALLGYDALAITLHEKQFDVAALQPYASSRGIVLVPGVERTIEGKHVVMLNFSAAAERVETFATLARLKAREPGLVVAPHPFYPLSSCVGNVLDRYASLFDAVEVNAMYARTIDFNRAAIRWATRHGKPLVGNCDVHRLTQLGSTYSIVDAERDPRSICEAIRAGRVEICTEPLGWPKILAILGGITTAAFWGLGRTAVRATTQTHSERSAHR